MTSMPKLHPGEAFAPHVFTPGYRSVSPTGNHNSVQLRPSAMASFLQTGIVESRKCYAMLDAGGNADMARRTRRECPASNSGVQRRLRLQKCKAFGISSLFAPAGIFVHVCRRCQRADRAGGFHVGLIFCNFSIKFSLNYSNGHEK